MTYKVIFVNQKSVDLINLISIEIPVQKYYFTVHRPRLDGTER